MPTLFVLDVAEFAPLVSAARKRADIAVAEARTGYIRLSSEGDLRIERAETGLTEALWFSAFTGGFKGGSLAIDSTRFVIAP